MIIIDPQEKELTPKVLWIVKYGMEGSNVKIETIKSEVFQIFQTGVLLDTEFHIILFPKESIKISYIILSYDKNTQYFSFEIRIYYHCQKLKLTVPLGSRDSRDTKIAKIWMNRTIFFRRS